MVPISTRDTNTRGGHRGSLRDFGVALKQTVSRLLILLFLTSGVL